MKKNFDDDLSRLDLKLGKTTTGGDLDAIPRTMGRAGLGPDPQPFYGYDLWNAYEVGFLLSSGKPAVGHLQIRYDALSPSMVESKSLKLFLNAQNQCRFRDRQAFLVYVSDRLTACLQSPVDCRLFEAGESPGRRLLRGESLDDLEPTTIQFQYNPKLLGAVQKKGDFAYHSHLFRSNCPITNQPDWGAVEIYGSGPRRPEARSLLAYLISYRTHQGFHESCCEHLFVDLFDLLSPRDLTICCHFTRRGGLDINPLRTTRGGAIPDGKTVWRQ